MCTGVGTPRLKRSTRWERTGGCKSSWFVGEYFSLTRTKQGRDQRRQNGISRLEPYRAEEQPKVGKVVAVYIAEPVAIPVPLFSTKFPAHLAQQSLPVESSNRRHPRG